MLLALALLYGQVSTIWHKTRADLPPSNTELLLSDGQVLNACSYKQNSDDCCEEVIYRSYAQYIRELSVEGGLQRYVKRTVLSDIVVDTPGIISPRTAWMTCFDTLIDDEFDRDDLVHGIERMQGYWKFKCYLPASVLVILRNHRVENSHVYRNYGQCVSYTWEKRDRFIATTGVTWHCLVVDFGASHARTLLAWFSGSSDDAFYTQVALWKRDRDAATHLVEMSHSVLHYDIETGDADDEFRVCGHNAHPQHDSVFSVIQSMDAWGH